MQKKYFYLAVFILFGFTLLTYTACDDIDNPLKEQPGKCGNEDGAIPIRKILVEDYTGHKCGNCPRAAEEIARLKPIYCDHIIPVAVHAGSFAEPAEHYPEDFRTEAGNAYQEYFKILGFPSGVINRTKFQGKYPLDYRTVWQSAIENQLTAAPDAELVIVNEYDNTTRELKTEITTEFFKDFSEKIKLTVFFTEDSIIAPQTDYAATPTTVENYAHRHVLRNVITDTWGDQLTASAKKGDKISKLYTFKIPNEYAFEHCEIIAFISKDKSREVIQAEAEHVVQE